LPRLIRKYNQWIIQKALSQKANEWT
jgi:hypothetical protein